MPTAAPKPAYALEAFNGSTGLYQDADRLRFIAVIGQRHSGLTDYLPEGYEYVSHGQPYRVTWVLPELRRGVSHPDLFDVEAQARHVERAAGQVRKAA